MLGPAADGGWWLLGVRRGSDASGLVGVEMSTSTTGLHTLDVLPGPTALLRTLRDVDTWADARAVADRGRRTRGSRIAVRALDELVRP